MVHLCRDTSLDAVLPDRNSSATEVSIVRLSLEYVTNITSSCRYAPVIESLVVAQQVVGIDFVGTAVAQAVCTIAIHIRWTPSSSVATAFFVEASVVDRNTCLEAQTIIDIDAALELTREAVFALCATVLVSQPVWVVTHCVLVYPVLHYTIEFSTTVYHFILTSHWVDCIVAVATLLTDHVSPFVKDVGVAT